MTGPDATAASQPTTSEHEAHGDEAERMVPELHRGRVIYAEHMVRYLAAASWVADKVVLDVACGSGYGSKLLAERARSVIGVDLAPDAVEYAREHYGAPNVEYRCGDALGMPVDDGSVDVVVSFETFEHVPDQERFLAEVKRVLTPGGVCLLSTPNVDEYPTGNAFHVKEFQLGELLELLSSHFAVVAPYYQGTWVCSAVADAETLSGAGPLGGRAFNLAPADPKEAVYFLVVCSDAELGSVVEPVVALGERWSARQIHEHDRELLEKQALTDDHVNNLTAMITDLRSSYAELKAHLEAVNEDREAVRATMEALAGRLEAIEESTSWRLLLALGKARSVPRALMGKERVKG